MTQLIGRTIIDETGRIGLITSETDTGVFVRPADTEYKISVNDAPANVQAAVPVAKAIIMTATHWTLQPDGKYAGMWYDSPLHTRLIAEMRRTWAD